MKSEFPFTFPCLCYGGSTFIRVDLTLPSSVLQLLQQHPEAFTGQMRICIFLLKKCPECTVCRIHLSLMSTTGNVSGNMIRRNQKHFESCGLLIEANSFSNGAFTAFSIQSITQIILFGRTVVAVKGLLLLSWSPAEKWKHNLSQYSGNMCCSTHMQLKERHK